MKWYRRHPEADGLARSRSFTHQFRGERIWRSHISILARRPLNDGPIAGIKCHRDLVCCKRRPPLTVIKRCQEGA
ncbi:hypothetical protein Bpfe_021184 [Biomphalaria pfeifferi]|uniref:Uncharacterized protein n=1 Tax=Biomphalaria pfeifferi TaxID=112525 RepID=A0AAD8F2M5_BIOPF|nr:hypothetical protein Bpfe_021184 [Biomphalaria pfeifferi]